MIVSKIIKWHVSHTELSKYLIERLLQLSDYDEVITNRHKTSNGYVLLSEINAVSRLVLTRQKSIHRFYTIIKESLETKLKFSVVNDPILNEFHKDIVDYYACFDVNSIDNDEKKIKKLQTKTRVFLKRLDLTYYDNIKAEFRKIDLKSSVKIRASQERIDALLEVLVPYLIFVGYSIETISKVSILLTTKGVDVLFRLFFSIFNLEEAKADFIVALSDEEDVNISLKKFLDQRGLLYSEHKFKDFEIDEVHSSSNKVLKFQVLTIDPNSSIRDIYDQFVKEFIISRDRTSLSYFSDFFNKTYWKLINGKRENYKNSEFKHDPINVISRTSTLCQTLIKTSDYYGLNFDENSSLYKIDCISESIYFYNLALGSKSIENSLNLLWTALETLIPYAKYENDIGNIQYFFPKFLSSGAVGRQLMSFILRFNTSNTQNGYVLNAIKTDIDYKTPFDLETIIKWFDFLTSEFAPEDDPYQNLKDCSELLCKQFCSINENWRHSIGEFPKFGKVKLFKDRIETSSLSIKYQLDRIYLHRNQIVHTAKFINEYSNLWSHLEWYVGKILAYFFIKAKQHGTDIKKADVLIELEGECEMIIQLIDRLSDKKIIDLTLDEKKKIFMQVWQLA